MTNLDDVQAELAELKASLAASEQAGRRRSRRLVGTNIVLAVAVLAFGGMSAAYALAPANSVNSASIIDRSIGTPDVKVGAFAGQTILDNSMTGLDINESTLELTCPTGMAKIGDICFSAEHAADDHTDASRRCVGDKLRLPSLTEGMLIQSVVGDPDNPDALWSDEVFWTEALEFLAVQVNISSWGFQRVTAPNVYRCVTTVGARP